jgi:hypothetical protein
LDHSFRGLGQAVKSKTVAKAKVFVSAATGPDDAASTNHCLLQIVVKNLG